MVNLLCHLRGNQFSNNKFLKPKSHMVDSSNSNTTRITSNNLKWEHLNNSISSNNNNSLTLTLLDRILMCLKPKSRLLNRLVK
jgi:hypothetical protein